MTSHCKTARIAMICELQWFEVLGLSFEVLGGLRGWVLEALAPLRWSSGQHWGHLVCSWGNSIRETLNQAKHRRAGLVGHWESLLEKCSKQVIWKCWFEQWFLNLLLYWLLLWHRRRQFDNSLSSAADPGACTVSAQQSSRQYRRTLLQKVVRLIYLNAFLLTTSPTQI